MYFQNKFTLNKILHIIGFVAALLLMTFLSAQAQTPPPSAAAPLDGFTSLLLAGGVGAGYYALRKRKEN